MRFLLLRQLRPATLRPHCRIWPISQSQSRLRLIAQIAKMSSTPAPTNAAPELSDADKAKAAAKKAEKERQKAEKDRKFAEKQAKLKAAGGAGAAEQQPSKKKANAGKKAAEEAKPVYVDKTPKGEKKGLLLLCSAPRHPTKRITTHMLTCLSLQFSGPSMLPSIPRTTPASSRPRGPTGGRSRASSSQSSPRKASHWSPAPSLSPSLLPTSPVPFTAATLSVPPSKMS